MLGHCNLLHCFLSSFVPQRDARGRSLLIIHYEPIDEMTYIPIPTMGFSFLHAVCLTINILTKTTHYMVSYMYLSGYNYIPHVPYYDEKEQCCLRVISFPHKDLPLLYLVPRISISSFSDVVCTNSPIGLQIYHLLIAPPCGWRLARETVQLVTWQHRDIAVGIMYAINE